jgi:hypothetical protein
VEANPGIDHRLGENQSSRHAAAGNAPSTDQFINRALLDAQVFGYF